MEWMAYMKNHWWWWCQFHNDCFHNDRSGVMWISVVHCWGNLWVPGVLLYPTNISTPLHSALTRILHIWYPIEWNRKDTFSCHLQIIHIFQGILKQKLKIEKLLKKILFRNGANCVRPDVCACQPGYTGTMCQTGDFLFVFVYLCICVFVYLCICVFYIWYTGISYLISLNPMLLKNTAHVGSFKQFVFVYLRICVFV